MDVAALYNKHSMNSSKLEVAAQLQTRSPNGTGSISNPMQQTRNDQAIRIRHVDGL